MDEIIDPFDNQELIAKQTALALKMKREGYDFFQIARALTRLSDHYVSPKLAHYRVRNHWQAIQQEASEEHRQWELDRLDNMLRRCFRTLREWGDDPDVMVKVQAHMLRIGERRAKLCGLDAPERVDATVVGNVDVSPELRERLDQVKSDVSRQKRKKA